MLTRKCSISKRNAFRAEALDFQKLQRGRRVFLQATDPAYRSCLFREMSQTDTGDSFADPGHLSKLAIGIAGDVCYTLRVAFNHTRGIADSCESESRPRLQSPSGRLSRKADGRSHDSPSVFVL